MGIRVFRQVLSLAVVVWGVVGPGTAVAGQPPGGTASSAARREPPAIRQGHTGTTAWMVARYHQLTVTKRYDAAARTLALDLAAPGDRVQFRIAADGVSVSREARTVSLDSADAIAALQQLLGGSPAVFQARELLSQFEAESALDTADMSLLSALAFVASLTGDSQAPRRLADRFVAKHRGFFRQIAGSGDTCWRDYTNEVTLAWNDLQQCMSEADEDVWWWAGVRRVACNGVWLLRSESAWFEYLKCLSPVSTLTP